MAADTRQISKRAMKMNRLDAQSNELEIQNDSISPLNPHIVPTKSPSNPKVERNPFKRYDNEIDFINDFNEKPGLIEPSLASRTSSAGPHRRSGFKLATWTFLAALIDTLILSSITCFCVLILAMSISKFKIDSLFFLIQGSNLVLTLIVSMVFLGWLYFVYARMLVGATVGEWSCSIRLGKPFERLQNQYMYKVLLRSSLNIMTGIILFPIISFLIGHDVLGKITGLRIYSLK